MSETSSCLCELGQQDASAGALVSFPIAGIKNTLKNELKEKGFTQLKPPCYNLS